jgi:TonB family protein
MNADDARCRPQSWEHLMHNDPVAGRGFRLGLVTAVMIHAGIFAVTWPTVGQVPPTAPEPVLIPVRLVDVVIEERRLEPVRIEPPPQRPVQFPIVSGPPDPPPEPVERLAADLSDTIERLVKHHPTVADIPPPPMVDTEPVLVGPDVAAPAVVFEVEPRYTEPARRACIEGTVILELILDTSGLVDSVTVLRGLPLGLTKNAVDAVSQWVFAPCTFHGEPVRARYILAIHFRLD